MASVIQLKCDCTTFPWGKKGDASLAARYAAATPGTTFKLDQNEHYSELWMGTYPATPSQLLSTGENLEDYINANKERLIGKPILDKFGADLPFVPRILSVSKTLPLQLHPDKELATKLYKHNPSKHGDPSHKPEIAIALSDFEAFVGFKHVDDINALFHTIPILMSYFVKQPETPFTSSTLVKHTVRDLLKLSQAETTEIYKTLLEAPVSQFGDQTYIRSLLPRIANEHGSTEPGCLVAVLTMNFLTLKKGEALYVPADGIHAYLSGDLLECMARTDNVLNTGSCPRADRDSVDLFTSGLTFDFDHPKNSRLHPKLSTSGLKAHTRVYAPPTSDFDVLATDLKGGAEEHIAGLQGPGIMVVTRGSGKLHAKGQELVIKEGYVFFVGFDTDLLLRADEGVQGLEVHISYSEA